MAEQPCVSVIVATYNLVQYLPRCLDSLIGQTLQNIEIIVVDDGSSDNTMQVLTEYAVRDSRIKAFQKPNGGSASTKNFAHPYVTGEYIGYVDGDDWVEPQMFERMYTEAKAEDADVVGCSYYRSFEDGKKIPKNLDHEPRRVYNEQDSHEFLRMFIGPVGAERKSPEFRDAYTMNWDKIYRTTFVRQYDFRFTDTSICQAEDVAFNLPALYYARKIVFINEHLYHYFKKNQSSQTGAGITNFTAKWEWLYEYMHTRLCEWDLPDVFFEALNTRICTGVVVLGMNTIGSNMKFGEKYANIKRIYASQVHRQALEKLNYKGFHLLWKIVLFCFAKGLLPVFYLQIKLICLLKKLKDKIK